MQPCELQEVFKKYKNKGIIKKYFIDKNENCFVYKDKYEKLGYGKILPLNKERLLQVLNSIKP